MTCQELVELVTDYLEGALPPEDAARFEQHLAHCPGCATYLDQVRTTVAVARAGGDQVKPSAVSPLLDAFRDWHSASSRPERRARTTPNGAATMATCSFATCQPPRRSRKARRSASRVSGSGGGSGVSRSEPTRRRMSSR
jgi:anti-sigma factor RsiW